MKHLAAAVIIGAGLILLDRIGFQFTMGTLHSEPDTVVLASSRYDEDPDDHAPSIH